MKNIENMIEKLVERVINEEVNTKVKNITESVSQEIDEMEEYYELAKKRKEERMANREDKDDLIGVYSDNETEDGLDPELSEEEMEEGNAFSAARAEAIKKGEDSFEVDGKTYPVKGEEDEVKSESNSRTLQLTEDEMIELIERIVKEQKIEGTSSEKTAMKTSKKDNEDYIKSVTKKMKDYIKDGSAGQFETNPESFPKGNGELGDNEKMAYKASDGVEEYIKQIARSGGQENLDYDQIQPDEEWLDLNLLGSSETGNNPEWGNAVKTKTGDEVKDRKDKNVLAKLKKQSYNKSPQPVIDYSGNKTHDKGMAGIEVSESKKSEKKKKVVNEEIDRIKNLFSHNYKTQ